MSPDHITAGAYNRNIDKRLARNMVWLREIKFSLYYYTSGSFRTHTSAWFLDREIHQLVPSILSLSISTIMYYSNPQSKIFLAGIANGYFLT